MQLGLKNINSFIEGVFDQIYSDTTSLHWLWTTTQWSSPWKDALQYRTSWHHLTKGLLATLEDCALIRRLLAPFEVKCWTLFWQCWLELLQQPRKWKGWTDETKIQCVAEDVLYFRHKILDFAVLTAKINFICCRSEQVKSSGLCYVGYHDRRFSNIPLP